MSVRRTIENNEEARIRSGKTYQSFVAADGGHRELNFIEKDMRNYITREVQNVSELEDAKEFEKYLLKMKEKNQNFFFELEIEDDQSIKIAFWANTRSRAACEYFRNVISFDTTYNTNKYNLVFGSFVGVNHHSQSTLLGCALMKNEDIQLFKWLFECWLHCMERNALKGILIDQCASMQRAIEGSLSTIQRKGELHHKINELRSRLFGNEVVKPVSNSTFNKFVVTYGSVAAQVKCQCLLFESRGILCRHTLSVLSFERVNKASPRYILERWSKNVKRRHTHIKSSHDEPLLEPRSKRFDELVFCSQNICEFASEFEELTAILHLAYDNVMVEM
ncbi:protein FAR-RED ELONGATED HYPOCOTYL 3-like [Arachis stenosperma]|uniref:protein FAR-RED ELONGATED HYPOCOTYL 3-like n=1 Tax=Arachis stenosperma TaxID=217475 RepID=UPI0025AC8FDF|nr:protein FAR-RED ELONGATED HYPOCOTYL 3-like [Arachis stenosperma]